MNITLLYYIKQRDIRCAYMSTNSKIYDILQFLSQKSTITIHFKPPEKQTLLRHIYSVEINTDPVTYPTGFSRCRVQDPAWPGKTICEPRPSFTYEDVAILPSTEHKFLGVFLDKELRWNVQGEKAIAKAVKWMLLACRLTKPSTGVQATYMRQLYCTVAIPKLTYAVDVWYMPVQKKEGRKKAMESVGLVCKLTSVQWLATIAITGAMRTTASNILEAHANVLPIELLLLGICHRAFSHMLALLKSHPLHHPLHSCTCQLVKRHPSPLHTLSHIFGLELDAYEEIMPFTHAPNTLCCYSTNIATSREESKEEEADDTADTKVFTDGSGMEGKTGAAEVLYRGRRIADLKYHLGTLAEHTMYEAEAVGVLLGLELLQHMKDVKKEMIFLDNQGVIQAIRHCQPKSTQYILGQIHELANRVATPSRRRRIDLLISWISGRDGVRSNEEVDVEAKRAAAGDNSQLSALPPLLEAKPLPYSLAAVQHSEQM